MTERLSDADPSLLTEANLHRLKALSGPLVRALVAAYRSRQAEVQRLEVEVQRLMESRYAYDDAARARWARKGHQMLDRDRRALARVKAERDALRAQQAPTTGEPAAAVLAWARLHPQEGYLWSLHRSEPGPVMINGIVTPIVTLGVVGGA